ncbi:MAG: hypothetical protein J3Q66DRAFT_373526 [Benniella sp.]|nr:MAG: hypothetical protein J3Q66DRAFT_373526 [Benniella sp.]
MGNEEQQTHPDLSSSGYSMNALSAAWEAQEVEQDEVHDDNEEGTQPQMVVVEEKVERVERSESRVMEEDETQDAIDEKCNSVVEECRIETDIEEEQDKRDVNGPSERTSTLIVASTAVAPEDANGTRTATVAPAKMASGVPNVPVKTGSNAFTPSQARGLPAASLALKKQAAEHAAAIKAHAVEIPETDSIANRIKMFGGGVAAGRLTGQRKLGVRDMVRKFTDAGDQNLDEIAHVSRGHHEAEPRGFCGAYSLSTTSRPLRPVPHRKMSHELDENEMREIAKVLGGMARSEHPQQHQQQHSQQQQAGVCQESVQSVKNAKSLFESLARVESGAQI